MQKKMQDAFAKGGESASTAFQDTLKALKSIDDPVKQNIAGINLFGTMWEDLGGEAVLAALDVQNSFDKTADTMKAITTIKYSSFSEGIKGIGRQLEVAVLPIGEKLVSYLNRLANFLNDKLPPAIIKLTEFFENNLDPAIVKVKNAINILKDAFKYLKDNMYIILPIIAGVAGAIGALVIATKVATVFNTLKKATEGMTIAQALLNSTLLANPILWIAIAVGVLVAAFVYAYKNSETFRNKLNELWEKIKPIAIFVKEVLAVVFKNAFSIIANHITHYIAMISVVLEAFITILNGIIDFITGIFTVDWKSAWEGIKNKLNELWEKIKTIAIFVGEVLAVVFKNAFSTIANYVTHYIAMISGVLEAFITILNGIIDFITGVFTGNWELAWEGIKEIFSGIWNGLKSIASGILNGIIDVINGIIGGINSLAEKASGVPLLSWAKGINIPLIPTFARGTNWFGGGVALVGEEGPELVNLPGGSSVKTASQTKNILNKSNKNVNVTLHIHGNFYGNDKAADDLGAKIAKEILDSLNNE